MNRILNRIATLGIMLHAYAGSQSSSWAGSPEPRVVQVLESAPSLAQYARWVSDLSGETEVVVRGNRRRITTRYAQAAGGRQAGEYLCQQLQGLGLEAELQPVPSIATFNLIVRLRGVLNPEEVVIISAHYDSLSEVPEQMAPGANDNASGAAGLLSVANILKACRCERTVELCFFAGEELDRSGSKAYAARCGTERKQIVCVLNMDVIMHPSDEAKPTPPFDIWLWANTHSEALARFTKQMLETYAPLRVQTVLTENEASDEASFWAIGAKGLLVYTTATSWRKIKHTIRDSLSQPGTSPECGLFVARGVAAAALVQAHFRL